MGGVGLKKHIFISIPRTGTNSVRRALGIKKEYNHRSAPCLRKQMGGFKWQQHFVFTFVRNPFDRLVSWYEYHRVPGHIPPQFLSVYADKSFTEWVKTGLPHHLRYTPQSGFEGYEDARPLHLCDYIYDSEGASMVDFVGRVENFNSDVVQLARRLGVKGKINVPHLNVSNRGKDYRAYYTPETRRIAENTFEEDLKKFGYSF